MTLKNNLKKQQQWSSNPVGTVTHKDHTIVPNIFTDHTQDSILLHVSHLKRMSSTAKQNDEKLSSAGDFLCFDATVMNSCLDWHKNWS